LLRTARLSRSATDEGALEVVASTACEVLGHEAGAVAVRGDDADHLGFVNPVGPPAGAVPSSLDALLSRPWPE
jgi:hypothetical protein